MAGLSKEDVVEWISVIEECDDEVLRMSSLPALQGILSKAEKLAGRIVSNEIVASLSGQDSTGGDRHGREQLIKMCESPSCQVGQAFQSCSHFQGRRFCVMCFHVLYRKSSKFSAADCRKMRRRVRCSNGFSSYKSRRSERKLEKRR